jgi:hypothetical protein
MTATKKTTSGSPAPSGGLIIALKAGSGALSPSLSLSRAFAWLRLPARHWRDRQARTRQRQLDPRREPAHWEDELLYLLPPFY